MTRDMELIRKIMLKAEADEPLDQLRIPAPRLHGHLRLLADAGFVEIRDLSTFDVDDLQIDRITWAGHEFLDAARNDAVWNRVRKQLKEKSLSVSLSVLQQLLIVELKRFLGLP